jgi:hypothetical protein
VVQCKGVVIPCFLTTSSMPDTKRSALKSLLNGVAWFFFVVAGIAFWLGGRAIHEFANTERVLAEMEGIGVAVLFGGLGAIAKSFASRFDDPSA